LEKRGFSVLSSKGIRAEQQLARLLRDRHYSVTRSAGSRGPMDIIAHKEKLFGLVKKKFGIQVKATRETESNLEKKEIENLQRAARSAGFEPVLAVRFGGEKWRFWREEPEDIVEETDFEYLLDKYKNRPSILLQVNDPRAKLLENVFS